LRKKSELDAAIIQEQRQGLNAVIEAQENERKRIAKDLHDSIAQELVALKLGFNKLRNRIEGQAPSEAALMLELENQLNNSCTEVRNISHIMMPPALEQAGLISALETLLHNVMQHSNIKAQIELGVLPSNLDKKIETGLYRIVQELLNNVIKHAQANHLMLQFYQANQNLIMRLEDDGIGFDYHHERNKGSMGLLNILSRVITLGGTFNTEPAEPHGTISTIRIPL
jgi:signal transduction histidine kinase